MRKKLISILVFIALTTAINSTIITTNNPYQGHSTDVGITEDFTFNISIGADNLDWLILYMDGFHVGNGTPIVLGAFTWQEANRTGSLGNATLGDVTASLSYTFKTPGTYHWMGVVNDTSGVSASSDIKTIFVGVTTTTSTTTTTLGPVIQSLTPTEMHTIQVGATQEFTFNVTSGSNPLDNVVLYLDGHPIVTGL